MFYDEVMNKYRGIYQKDKDTKAYLVHEDEKGAVEFFPQLEDDIIQYSVVEGDFEATNNSVGYVDHLSLHLLLSDKWSLIEK